MGSCVKITILKILTLDNMSENNFPERVPEVTFKTRVYDESVEGPNPFRWQDKTTDEVFKGKKIILFAIPGAFTPTCSSKHLPGYEEKYDEIKELGVDEVICLSVNDAFVMYKWGQDLGVEKVQMLPDGNADFTSRMNMLVDKANLGFGKRSWRYSMLVEDGEIKKLFIEPGKSDNFEEDPFGVSGANTMVEYLKEK